MGRTAIHNWICATETDSTAFAISCRSVSVSFGEVAALADVSVDFPRDGIHAVVGQNGAGKTTFARVVAGLVRPDSGALSVNGRRLGLGSVTAARSAGIELVHQSFALPPSFTVAEAIEFGIGRGIGFFSRRKLLKLCKEHLELLGMDIDPCRRIRELSIEQQQAVEIARALASDAAILILDEPTAVLPPSGVDNLFDRVRKLKRNGVTIVLILHKTREVWAIADTITILRNGCLIAGPVPLDDTDPDRIGRMIMGAKTEDTIPEGGRTDWAKPAEQISGARNSAECHKTPASTTALELRGVCTTDTVDGACLNDVSMSVMPGEIVGIAGVEGNGQTNLVKTLAGLLGTSNGEIEICGRAANGLDSANRRSLGLRIIPFDRNSEGLSMNSALWENWVAGELAAMPLLSTINPANLRKRCSSSISEWNVRHNSVNQLARSLSGGNAQKLILSREIDDSARMIIAAQPTRGLDIGATEFVRTALRRAVAGGCGVLLISSDLDELFEVGDRILVMLSGRIVGELNRPYDLAAAGRAMIGATG